MEEFAFELVLEEIASEVGTEVVTEVATDVATDVATESATDAALNVADTGVESNGLYYDTNSIGESSLLQDSTSSLEFTESELEQIRAEERAAEIAGNSSGQADQIEQLIRASESRNPTAGLIKEDGGVDFKKLFEGVKKFTTDPTNRTLLAGITKSSMDARRARQLAKATEIDSQSKLAMNTALNLAIKKMQYPGVNADQAKKDATELVQSTFKAYVEKNLPQLQAGIASRGVYNSTAQAALTADVLARASAAASQQTLEYIKAYSTLDAQQANSLTELLRVNSSLTTEQRRRITLDQQQEDARYNRDVQNGMLAFRLMMGLA